ncbi:LytTR family DNA-binding domain-containing protein [Oscillospiraceae bacterium PP1C4]
MKIAVIDDERPSRSELKHLILEVLPDAVVDEADSGQKAVELASAGDYDALFVDVHLGDIEGTTLSLMLKKLLPRAQIVFATAYDEYAVKAFDMDAVDYIMKPFDPKRVEHALDKISARLAEGTAPVRTNEMISPIKKLSISCDKRVVVVDIDVIAYIETDSRNCILHTCQGDYSSTQSLGYFEKKLAPVKFFRIHKSYLVNLQYVVEFCPWFNGMFSVKLKGYEKENLPVSRKQIKKLKEIFEI